VSLSAYQERIEQAAANGDADAALRDHLRGCDECRAHYDALRLAARALGDEGAGAERQRLTARLPSRGARAPLAAAVGLALAAGLLLVVLKPQRHGDGVALRGGPERPGAPAPFSLRIYAKDAPGQPVHLVADFPGSGEAAVGVNAEVQLFVKPPPPPGLVLVTELTSGQRSVVARAESGDTELKAVGAPFAAGSLGPGDAKLCAVLAKRDGVSIEALKRDGQTASEVYCGTLKVTP